MVLDRSLADVESDADSLLLLPDANNSSTSRSRFVSADSAPFANFRDFGSLALSETEGG